MSQPLLDFLTGRAKQALPYLRAEARKGSSPSEAIDALKGLNLTFNRQRMLDVYGSLVNRIDPARVERLVGSSTPFPVDLHTVPPWDITSAFQYEVNVINARTDEEEYLTVSSSVPLAAEVIRDRATILFNTGQYFETGAPPVTADSVNIINAFEKSPTP